MKPAPWSLAWWRGRLLVGCLSIPPLLIVKWALSLSLSRACALLVAIDVLAMIQAIDLRRPSG
jgi:hypothetical protein